jgi:hypothetical protein
MDDKNDGQLPLPHIPAALEANQGPLPKGMPTLPVIKAETARLGLPDSDAEAIFDYWLSNGFRTKVGKIKDFKATIRNWVRNSYFPSLKRANKWAARDQEAEQLAQIRRAKERSKKS